MPDPIRQEIETTFDPTGVERAIDSTRDMAEEVELASERAQIAAKSSRDQEAALVQLVAEQQRYEERVKSGEQVDEQAELRARERAEAIEALAAQIQEKRRADERATEAAAALVQVEQQAVTVELTREQLLAENKRKLEELLRVQDRYANELRSGTAATDASERAERERLALIDRLSREVAEAEDHQARLNRELRQSVQAHRQVSDTGEDLAETQSVLSEAADSVGAAFTGLATGMLASQGVNAVFEEYEARIEATTEALKRNATAASAAAESRLNLVALRGVEDPADVARLDQLGAFSGRSAGEVARASAVVQSQLPQAGGADRDALLVELAVAGQQTTSDLQTLIPGLVGIFKQVRSEGIDDPARVAGNLFQAAVEQAGQDDPGKLSDAINRFLGLGKELGGLRTSESVGFAAAGTGLGLGSDDRAITGLTNIIFALRGRGTPEGVEILDREGIERGQDADLLAAIRQLSGAVQAGRVTAAEVEAIGGREAAPAIATLSDLSKLQDFEDQVAFVVAAGEREGRIGTDKAEALFLPNSPQGLNLQSKQASAATEAIRAADTNALRIATARQIFERELAEREQQGTLTPRETEIKLNEFDRQIGKGTELEQALTLAAGTQTDIATQVAAKILNLGGLFDFVQPTRFDRLEGPLGIRLDAKNIINELDRGPVTDAPSLNPPPAEQRPPGVVVNYNGPVYQGGDPATNVAATRGVDGG